MKTFLSFFLMIVGLLIPVIYVALYSNEEGELIPLYQMWATIGGTSFFAAGLMTVIIRLFQEEKE